MIYNVLDVFFFILYMLVSMLWQLLDGHISTICVPI